MLKCVAWMYGTVAKYKSSFIQNPHTPCLVYAISMHYEASLTIHWAENHFRSFSMKLHKIQIHSKRELRIDKATCWLLVSERNRIECSHLRINSLVDLLLLLILWRENKLKNHCIIETSRNEDSPFVTYPQSAQSTYKMIK